MIVIPPRDPNEQYPTDPAAEALGKAYEQFTNVQNLSEFHAALRKRDALYDRQLAQLDEDRLYYFGKLADAASEEDRERYLTALIGRLNLSGDVGLLYKDDAHRLIENIPSDYDIFKYNREYANDPARAQRLLLYGTYPNIRPELREELVKAANSAAAQSSAQAVEPVVSDLPKDGSADEADLETNVESATTSNDQNVGKAGAEISRDDTTTNNPIEIAAAGSKKENAGAGKQRINGADGRSDRRAAYGETNGLYPQVNTFARDPYSAVYDPKKADADSLKELQKARADIAQVERNRRASGATTGIERKDLRSGDANEQRQWKLASDAANQPSDLPPDVRHFFMRAHTGLQKPDWAGDREPYKTYGPFINVGGGPVPRSTLVYIDFYQGVPLAKDKGK